MDFRSEVIDASDMLLRLALRLTHNRSAAEDLVQETMLRAFTYENKFQIGTNLKGWLSTIQRNVFLTSLRRNRLVNDPDDVYTSHLTVDPTQEIQIQWTEFTKVFDTLSDEHKESLQLICIDGRSYEEVSEILNIKVGTAKSRVSRARKELREQMELLDPDQISIAVRTYNDNFRHSHR